jgi:hypothetical protein
MQNRADLLNTRPEQFAECTSDARLLACARRTIEEHMRKVAR